MLCSTLAAFLMVLVFVANASAFTSPHTFEGSIAKTSCEYKLTTSWSGATPEKGELTGSVTCESAFVVKLSATWNGTTVTLGEVSGSLHGFALPTKDLGTVFTDHFEPTGNLEGFVESFAETGIERVEGALLKSPQKIEGKIAKTGCTYALTATWSGTELSKGKLAGTVTCGAAFSVTLTASWKEAEATLESVSGSLEGNNLGEQKLSQGFSLPDEGVRDLPDLIESFLPDALQAAQSKLLKSPLKLEGKIGHSGCTYAISATWSGTDLTSGTLTGTVGCGSEYSAEIQTTWSDEEANIESLTVTVDGLPLEPLAIGQRITMADDGPLDLPDLIESLAPEIAGVASGSVADSVLLGAGDPHNALESLLEEGPEGLPSTLLGALDKGCTEHPTIFEPVCKTGVPPVPPPKKLPPLKATRPGYNSLEQPETAEDGPCPRYASLGSKPPEDDIVICEPTLLVGKFDAGNKNVLLVPGGALVAAGPSSGPFEPTIKTSGSVVLLGGAVGGIGLKIQAAGDVEVAGTYVSMIHALQIEASGSVKIGEADVEALLGSLPGVPGAPFGNRTIPSAVFAGNLTIAGGETAIGSGSTVSSSGLGGPGGPSNGFGTAPGGASGNFGGSHGGLGSYPDNFSHGRYGRVLLGLEVPAIPGEPSPPGRGKTFDDPFNPQQPGAGGGGVSDDGHRGGGVITLRTASLTVGGTISSDGDGAYHKEFDNGGAGAGGTVNITTGALTGAGTISANGGGACALTCLNGGHRGSGGGGEIAERYISDTFTGEVSAFGGADLTSDNQESEFDPNGGAGTLFQLPIATAPSAPTIGSSAGEEEAEAAAGPSGQGEAVSSVGAGGAPALGSPAVVRLQHHDARGCRGAARARRSRAGISATARRAIACVASHPPVPRLTALLLSPSAFPADSSGAGATSARVAAGTGTTISYDDSLAATTTFRVGVPAPGLLERASCVKAASVPARKRSKLKRCRLFELEGSFAHRDKRGKASLHFTGRLARGPLAPGAYELQATPRLGARQGATVTLSFRVLSAKVPTTSGPTTPPSTGGTTSKPAPAGETPPPSGEPGLAGGTLIIDGGSYGDLPATDGTPLPDSWSEKERALVIRGGARVYASSPEYAKITISGGSRLTVTPTAALPESALKVTAVGSIEVDSTSSIEVNGDGYAGAGSGEEFGTAPKGVRASDSDTGGSHGGAGGINTFFAHESGATYDSPSNPTQPGAGGGGDAQSDDDLGSSGGGVVYLNASSLVLNGSLSANAQNNSGPTLEEPFFYGQGAGTGAGGSIQVHVQTLTGGGAIEADGGVPCVHPDELLKSLGPACQTSGPGGASGGGGLALVVAPNAGGFTGRITAKAGAQAEFTGQDGIVTGP
jgi:hypothetical protein